MDARTRQKFTKLWMAGEPLSSIAMQLGYSFSTLAKLRMIYGLEKRYGADDDSEPPAPDVIRLRCMEQQTNWTPNERRLRWQGEPHTIFTSITGYDGQ